MIVGLPSDEVRSTLLSVSPEERKHLEVTSIHDGEQVAEDVEELHFVSSALDEERYLVAFTRRDSMAAWIEQLASNDSLKVFTHLRRSAYRLRATSVVPSLMVMRWFYAGVTRMGLASICRCFP